jgi:glycogen operon protein
VSTLSDIWTSGPFVGGIAAGQSFPLGAAIRPGGVNFCVFSKSAANVELLLFDHVDQRHPSRVVPFDPQRNRTFYYWHAFVPGVQPGGRRGIVGAFPYLR